MVVLFVCRVTTCIPLCYRRCGGNWCPILLNLNFTFCGTSNITCTSFFFLKKTCHASCSGCSYFSTFSYNKARGIQTVLQDKAFSGHKFQSANKLIQLGPKGEIPERLY